MSSGSGRTAGLQQVCASLTPLEPALPKVLSPELEGEVTPGLHCSNGAV